MNRTDPYECLARVRVPLVVSTVPPAAADPGERPLHDPALRQFHVPHRARRSLDDLDDAPALLALLGRHPQVKAVASGHLHAAAEEELDGVTYLLGPSTALQLVHEHPLPEHNLDPTPIGARLIDLHDDGTVTSELLWTT